MRPPGAQIKNQYNIRLLDGGPMEDLYICSPYLSTNEKTGNNRSVLINHLTARAVALGNNEVELLHSRHSPHHISFFLESFGTVVVDRWIQKTFTSLSHRLGRKKLRYVN